MYCFISLRVCVNINYWEKKIEIYCEISESNEKLRKIKPTKKSEAFFFIHCHGKSLGPISKKMLRTIMMNPKNDGKISVCLSAKSFKSHHQKY